MKGKKRIIVTLLFFINIIMLVAAVIPHHHHPNGMISHEAGLACRTAMSLRIIITRETTHVAAVNV